jgi:hypothetical protein
MDIISKNNIDQINTVSTQLLSLLKEKKFFFVSENYANERVKASCEFFMLIDVIAGSRFKGLETECDNDLAKLKSLSDQLYKLLGYKRKFTLSKLKDYSGDIKPKLCRELIGDLEDLFILGDITMTDIKGVYDTLNKKLPKKYATQEMTSNAKVIYSAINSAIKEDAQRIRISSIAHYQNMVKLIDPNDTLNTVKSFFLAGRKKNI